MAFEILLAILLPLVYLSPVGIALYRDINYSHVIVCGLMTALSMFMWYPFWFIPILVSVLPRKVVETLPT